MTGMDHGSAHERIEDLTLEPARLRALPSSTDPADVALREHLDGCAACRADLDSWARVHAAVGDALVGRGPEGTGPGVEPLGAPEPLEPGARPAALEPLAALGALEPLEPPASLRSRVLAAVRAENEVTLAPVPMAAAPATTAGTPHHRWFDRPHAAWLGLAAALVVLVIGAGLLADQAGRLSAARSESEHLAAVMTAVDRVLTTDHVAVPLRTAAGAPAGSITWSRHDWVVLTTGLAAPPPGKAYLCWLEAEGKSVPIGEMDFAGATAYWVATVDAWQTWEIGPTTRFVVSLESGSPPARTGDAVLSANLAS
jgi:hypothetical protein